MDTTEDSPKPTKNVERFQIAASGNIVSMENLTRTGRDTQGGIKLIENREAQSPPDQETLETYVTRYGWVALKKEDLLTPGGRLPMVREEVEVMQWLPKMEGVRANSVPSRSPAFMGELRVDRIRMLLQQKKLLGIVAAGGTVRVELVERVSKKHQDDPEKYPEDTLFYPTGRFAREDGSLINLDTQPATSAS